MGERIIMVFCRAAAGLIAALRSRIDEAGRLTGLAQQRQSKGDALGRQEQRAARRCGHRRVDHVHCRPSASRIDQRAVGHANDTGLTRDHSYALLAHEWLYLTAADAYRAPCARYQ